MKKTISLVIVLICIFACSGPPGMDMDLSWRATVDKTYYPEGSLKETETRVNGLLEGPSQTYYQNGQLKEDVMYKNNLMEGPSKSYFQSGAIKAEKNWLHGKLEGQCTFYCENGKIQEQGHYKTGKFHGKHKRYFDCTDSLAEVKTYNNGLLDGERIIYFPDEKIREKMTYTDGKLQGTKRVFYPNGKKKQEENYADGEFDGLCHYYYPNGSLMQEIHYSRGKKHGIEKLFYKRGNIQKEIPYKNGLIDGTVKQYAGSGYLWLIENYKYDKLHGKSIQYSKSGHVIKELNYFHKDVEKLREEEIKALDEKKRLLKEEQRLVKKNLRGMDDKSEFTKKEKSRVYKIPLNPSESGYVLRYRMRQGETRHYATLSKEHVQAVSGKFGIDLGRQISIQSKFSVDRIAENTDKQRNTRIYIYDMNMNIHTRRNDAKVDCTNAIGQSFKLNLSDLGHERDYFGIEGLTIEIPKAGGAVETHPLLDYFKDIFPDLPEKPVKPGDRWNIKKQEESLTPQGLNQVVETETVFVLEGETTMKNKACVKITGGTKGNARLTGRDSSGYEIRLNGNVKGSIDAYFDPINGVLIKIAVERVYSGKMSLKKVGKSPIDMPYTQIKKIHMVLME